MNALRKCLGWCCRHVGGTLPLLAVLVTAAFGIWQLSETERQKLEWDRYQRKAAIYEEIAVAMVGFYESARRGKGEREAAMEKFRLCEMHCPDVVLRAGYTFLASVEAGAETSELEQQRALNAFKLSLRRDLQPETKIAAEELRNWVAE